MFQLAALTSELFLSAIAADADGYIQALPDGEFKAVDGRPHDVASGHWLMDAAAFETLKQNTPHQQGDLVIDYEHQTLNKEKNGQPAPAAGFFHISNIEYREGEGLFIKPDFNDKAKAHLNGGEYKYFSLVFGYDTTTGRPTYIHSGALTNRPGVDGMVPLAALTAQLGTQFKPHSNQSNQGKQEFIVNETLIKLLAKLGIEVGDNAEVTTEQAQAALTALETIEADAGKVEGLNTQVAALTAQDGKQVDLSKFVPVETFNSVREQLVALTAENGQLTIEQAVKQGIEDGKVFESEKDYLIQMGKQQGMAALTANLESRQAIAALSGKQTNTVQKPDEQDQSIAALTAEEIQVAKAWGMTPEAYATAKKEQA